MTVGGLDGPIGEAADLNLTVSSISDLIHLVLESLVLTVASSFHGGRNKAIDAPLENRDQELSNGASWAVIGRFLCNRPSVQT